MNHTDLIIDVGMHNGDDTAYYLSRGFRVVAIEANPTLCEDAHQRFSQEIDAGRLLILNVGIAATNGRMTFWVNSKNSEWSSFDREFAERLGGECHSVEVESRSFAEIITEHGTPHYLKIDIEGADSLCLAGVDPLHLPKYISVEAHSLIPLYQLNQLGFTEFKCINQRWHHSPELGVNQTSELRRAVQETASLTGNMLDGGLRSIPGVGRVWNRLRKSVNRRRRPPLGGVQPLQECGASGPFGEDTAGPWRSFNEVAYDWLHVKMGHPLRSTLKVPGWYDFHARSSP